MTDVIHMQLETNIIQAKILGDSTKTCGDQNMLLENTEALQCLKGNMRWVMGRNQIMRKLLKNVFPTPKRSESNPQSLENSEQPCFCEDGTQNLSSGENFPTDTFDKTNLESEIQKWQNSKNVLLNPYDA